MTANQTPEAKTVTGSGLCKCGCDVLVGGMGKALYRPGHDAKHVSNLVRAAKAANADQQAKIQKIASKDLSQALFLKFLRGLGK